MPDQEDEPDDQNGEATLGETTHALRREDYYLARRDRR